MTRIAPLRKQLASLRETRQWLRWATGGSGLALALLWTLAFLFVLDVVFQLSLLQRFLLLLVAAAGIVWAWQRLTRPFLNVHEDDFDVALLVEKEHQIDNDLIAAMQFELPQARGWGSPQLETAVVEYVAELGGSLNVFQGLSREQLVRRATLLALTLAAAVAISATFPGHVGTFLQRLFLGARHYPTATQIQQISINRIQVLQHAFDGTQPHPFKAPQGQALRFEVLCHGDLPEQGTIRFVSGSAQTRKVDLQRRSLEQRLARLRDADAVLSGAAQDAEQRLREAWRSEVSGALRFDAPAVAEYLHKAPATRDTLDEARERLATVIQQWPGAMSGTSIYSGELTRLVDAIQYKIYLGDAWTDSAAVEVIPLPVVELRLEVTPPEYARETESAGIPAARQLAVLEGSSVAFAIEVMNRKRLAEAWVVVKSQPEPTRLALSHSSPDSNWWRLDDPDSPFRELRDELHFEVQVRDTDGMTLERPLQGFVRLRSDRPPTGAEEIVHRVVLPQAKPVVAYRANDDFGISGLRLLVQVEPQTRNADADSSRRPVDDSETAPPTELPVRSIDLLPAARVYRTDQLPLAGTRTLDLARWKLSKGDRLRVILEVRDFRGDREGQLYLSDPLFLEISDESGVYAAILEADQKSEKQLSEIIQRELGIGETP